MYHARGGRAPRRRPVAALLLSALAGVDGFGYVDPAYMSGCGSHMDPYSCRLAYDGSSYCAWDTASLYCTDDTLPLLYVQHDGTGLPGRVV